MGKYDLVIIINGIAYLVKDKDYQFRSDAITYAISKHEESINANIKFVEEATNPHLIRPKEQIIADMETSLEVEKIEIYDLVG